MAKEAAHCEQSQPQPDPLSAPFIECSCGVPNMRKLDLRHVLVLISTDYNIENYLFSKVLKK